LKNLKEYSITRRNYPLSLFTYPCVDPNTDYFENKNIMITEKKLTTLGEQLIEKCKDKGAKIFNTINEDIDILIVNSPYLIKEKPPQTEEAYFDVLFHYLRPAKKALSFMLKRNRGQIVFILPPQATIHSVEYAQMASFAVVGLMKGLALEYAPKGIVVNGIVLGESEDYDTVAEWVAFLASGNARNIVGELIIFDAPIQ
jgi:NAD(P)-dependent dehydrogenase (short-subunit alcohol dehydrogenase family)